MLFPTFVDCICPRDLVTGYTTDYRCYDLLLFGILIVSICSHSVHTLFPGHYILSFRW